MWSISDVIPLRLPAAHSRLAFAGYDLNAEPEHTMGMVDDDGVEHRYGVPLGNAVRATLPASIR